MGEGKGTLCWRCPGGPHILLFDDCEGFPVVVSVSAVCRQPAPRPLRAGYFSREHGKSSRRRRGRGAGRGALVLALTPCYTGDPAREARMEHRWRSGTRGISGICSSPSIRLMSYEAKSKRRHKP
jgi:hypothetical protein